MQKDLSRIGDDGGRGGAGEAKQSSLIMTKEITLMDANHTLHFLHPSQANNALFLLLVHVHPLRANQHHTRGILHQDTTMIGRLMIRMPKHLHPDLLALRQIIPIGRVHSFGIRKSGVKGCESAFDYYDARLGTADFEFVAGGCGGHFFGTGGMETGIARRIGMGEGVVGWFSWLEGW